MLFIYIYMYAHARTHTCIYIYNIYMYPYTQYTHPYVSHLKWPLGLPTELATGPGKASGLASWWAGSSIEGRRQWDDFPNPWIFI